MKRSIARMQDMLARACPPLLMLAALAYPFSVAAANAALGALLGLGVVSGRFAVGARWLWRAHRPLTLAALVYLALLPLGLLWSPEPAWGAHLMARQWFWFVIPVIVACIRHPREQQRVFLALSAGLSAHLLFCVGQMLGWIQFAAGGSSADDPTGHIGHIGFGLVHGLWAAWLVHWGMRRHGWKRAAAWLVACWAVVMVFIAAGRSGYLVVTVIAVVMAWRLPPWTTWRKAALAAMLLIAIGVGLTASHTARERLIWTWQGFQALEHGDFRHANARWSLWYAAIRAWREHPWFGVGTGGFRSHAAAIKRARPDLLFGGPEPAHPHNMYLLALVRWGPAGLAALLTWLGLWMRAGWREDWHESDAGLLVALPAVALAAHGLSAPSLEEHFPGVLAAMLAGLGLAARKAAMTNGDKAEDCR